ncbi:bifunctional ADP-dependent NAD(P)H-hydrate dehydratase/NAD(P)H-hydrate epimerase [Arthrobacter sp. H14]|uniref:bifunctional ADP-dependent NAD(P)H-hydrate dehydratase/NAD(P)H-hydrate epimerase n=1 Tax=Arthrobacter sp. H14 TaxID=1312959 RepID=UPI00047E1A3B|nr:bifunctional ADP-dependent NAD(P)H-hydrate dehydratase/NAD(P)H-hydrate epimerase [Arthrobacter sp. H14]
MIHAYTGTQIRAAEAPLLENGQGDALMQRAAYGLASAVLREVRRLELRVYGGRLVVLAGSGNNGGDVLFAAARLSRQGMGTTAVLTSARVHPEALAAFRKAGGRVQFLVEDTNGSGSDPGPDAVSVSVSGSDFGTETVSVSGAAALCRDADVVIDGILGTGARGGLRQPVVSLVEQLVGSLEQPDNQLGFAADWPAGIRRETKPLIVACDLPSGINADSGEVAGPVLTADLTVTFGGAKSGLYLSPAAGYTGRVETIRIGIDEHLPEPNLRRLETGDLARLWTAPDPGAHKYSRGVLGIVAGSAQYPGAALLTAGGALATGVGMIRYLGPEPVSRLINLELPEVVCSQDSVSDSHVQAWLVGPGIGDDKRQLRRARDAITSGLPTVVDASALPLLPGELGPNVLLTPHAGELSAVLKKQGIDASRNEIEASGAEYARLAAGLTGATVLLKGGTTLVASPSGALFSQAEGTSWLSTAGSGDTLAGILGALMATFAEAHGITERAMLATFAEAPGTEAPGMPPSSAIAGMDKFAVLGAMAASIHGRAAVLASGGGPISSSQISKLMNQVFISIQHGDT